MLLPDVLFFVAVWLFGAMLTGQLLDAWFNSHLPRVLFGWTDPEADTSKELLESWIMNPPFGSVNLGIMLNCRVCLGNWIALTCSSVLVALCIRDYYLGTAMIATSPGWAYIANLLSARR